MSQTKDIIHIYKSRNNILEILKSQNYNTSNYDYVGINEVHSMFVNNQLDMILTKNNDKKKVYIKYHLEKTLNETKINEYIEDLFVNQDDMVLNKEDDLIIIIKDEPNETIIKILKNTWEREKYYINIFNIKRLQFNILNHELVSPHIVLSDQEAIEMKKRFNITDNSQLPDISRFDPVAQAICIRPGQICKIERPSRSAITTTFYRICSS